MRVVLISDVFSKKMGYLENTLSKCLARKGVELHLLTTGRPPYYQVADFQKTFGRFNHMNALNPGTVEQYDGYTLHVLPHQCVLGYTRMIGLSEKLGEIRPDIVQTFDAIGWMALDPAIFKHRYGYKLFTGNHTAASTFPLANRRARFCDPELLKCMTLRYVPGRVISWGTEKCYAVAADRAMIAKRYFGVQPHKVIVQQLGVDTETFIPATSVEMQVERTELRRRLGYLDEEILCIFTGQLIARKKAPLLAYAVERLRSAGHPYRALFIGDGPLQAEVADRDGSACFSFMPYPDLPPFYRASDIAVWPGDESISMFDAAASGLPLVVSDVMGDFTHVNGNGIVFKRDNIDDLAAALLKMRDSETRRGMSAIGVEKMRCDEFSMEGLVTRRLLDYESALHG